MFGRVLITGGHGNLGSYITKRLCEEGYEVYVLTRKVKDKLQGINYEIIEADITNFEQLNKKLNFEVDYCIHTASFNEFFLPDYPKKALEINTLGTRNLIEILSTKKIKHVIYFSTFHVYGVNSGIIDENSSLEPKNDYASTHLFAEYYIKQFGFTHNLPYTILRLTNSYGVPSFKDTDKWYLVLNDLVKSAYEKGKIILKSNGKAKRDFIYMGDVAKIVHKLLNVEATNSIYNLSSNKSNTIIDLANKVQKIYAKKYSQKIDIELNQNDQTEYKELEVSNVQLNSIVSLSLNDVFDSEIEHIFELLEIIYEDE